MTPKPTNKSQKNVELRENKIGWWLVFAGILGAGFVTRFYNVSEPEHVCWDEHHFGKMGSWYINRTFFFDVHPPLGKMLIALTGYLTGYDGSFHFDKPGDKYDGVSYLGMRLFCTFLGTCMVPFSFLTVWELTKSLTAAFLASLFILCDVGMVTISQYILLDPILLFFISGAFLGIVKVRGLQQRAFNAGWWGWLVWTGVMLAGALGVKFVGVFVVLLAGMYTIAELWELLGQMPKSASVIFKHFYARVGCLILLPCTLYLTFFYIHLSVLNRSGKDDGFFSSEFQSQLIGNPLNNASMPGQLAYGAIITLRNIKTSGGYLHSHSLLYPEGFGLRQQQITMYGYNKDVNNKWKIKPSNVESYEDVVLVKNGDLIRLEHVATGKNLHSHFVPAPLTHHHSQVTGFGENGIGDYNDEWKILIKDGADGQVVQTVVSKLQLVHREQGCVLRASSKQLPKWAGEQSEVSCNHNVRDTSSFWNVEYNEFPHLPNVSLNEYAPGFFMSFIESHVVMLQINNGMKVNREIYIDMRPWEWPINYRGINFSRNPYVVYLLGNPVIWWGNLIFLHLTLILLAYDAVMEKMNTPELDHVKECRKTTAVTCAWLFIGWLLHYLPFWFMARFLLYHHYFPASYFSSMLSGVCSAYILECLPRVLSSSMASTAWHTGLTMLISVSSYSFYFFAPLAYGITPSTDQSTIKSMKWLDSWGF